MFTYQTCAAVPVRGGRRWYGGGVVEVEGRVVWGGAGEGVYRFDEVRSKWERLADDEDGATLAVCGGEMVSVGGLIDDDVYSKVVRVWRGGRWTSMTEMLVRCSRSCVVSVSGGVLLVMGGVGDGYRVGDGGMPLNDVQIFDGRTWHMGPPLPHTCSRMSAVVHGDLVFVVGGVGMKRAVWSANITDLVSH